VTPARIKFKLMPH